MRGFVEKGAMCSVDVFHFFSYFPTPNLILYNLLHYWPLYLKNSQRNSTEHKGVISFMFQRTQKV